MDENKIWYLLPKGSKKEGPFSHKEIRDRLKFIVHSGLKIRKGHEGDWIKLGDAIISYPNLIDSVNEKLNLPIKRDTIIARKLIKKLPFNRRVLRKLKCVFKSQHKLEWSYLDSRYCQQKLTCTTCGTVEHNKITAHHQWENIAVDLKLCTTIRSCNRCSKLEKIFSHEWGEWSSKWTFHDHKACRKTRICKNCDMEEIRIQPHKWEFIGVFSCTPCKELAKEGSKLSSEAYWKVMDEGPHNCYKCNNTKQIKLLECSGCLSEDIMPSNWNHL